MTQIRFGLRRGDIPLIGGIQRLAGGAAPPNACSSSACARAVACTNRGNRAFLQSIELRVHAGHSFNLLEQRQVPRRNLAQLGVQILDWDFPLSQDSEERGHRRVGDAKVPTDFPVIPAEWPAGT